MLFQPFKKATRPETPGFLQAEIDRGNFEQREKQYENSQRQQMALGGAELYNDAMGPDKNPIYDSLFGVEEVAAAEELAAGTELAGLSEAGAAGAGVNAGVPLAAGTSAGTGAAGAAAGTAEAAAAAAAAEAAAATAAGTTAAGTTAAAGAGGTSALAALGPYGWAALAAMALLG